MSNDKFDVEVSFKGISFGAFLELCANIVKQNPELLTSVTTQAENLNLHSTNDQVTTGAAGKADEAPKEEKKSRKKSEKSETKSGPKDSDAGTSKAESEDEESEPEVKETKKKKATSEEPKKNSKKTKEPEPDEDEEDENDEEEAHEPVKVPDEYTRETLDQLLADIADQGIDILDEALDFFDVKKTKDLQKADIKPFYKKAYKLYVAAKEEEEDGE